MMSNEQAWENKYAAVKKDETLWGKKSIPYIDTIVKTFRSINASRVLDFPCGDGRNTIILAGSFDIVVGADSSKSALKMCVKEADRQNISRLVTVETNLFSSCFISDYFDGILCWDVLGHLENPENAMDELLRICKPCGIIIGSFFSKTDPCVSDSQMVQLNENDYRYKGNCFYRFYTEKMIKDFLASFNGVDVLAIEHVIWIEPPHEGFREYDHEHHSWATIIKKK